MDQDKIKLTELREEVFADYRAALAKSTELREKVDKAQEDLKELALEREKASANADRLKSMIDIMITEDCDPVMAKLRYEDRIQENTVKQDAGMSFGWVGTQSATWAVPAFDDRSMTQIPSRPVGIINRLRRLING